jgi:hypothetical protein
MRLTGAALSASLLAIGCAETVPTSDATQFHLCDAPGMAVIRIDYARLYGVNDDVGRIPLSTCGEGTEACISYPIRIAAPPRLPKTAGEDVRWSVGDHDFRIARRGTSDDYLVEAVLFRRSGSGREFVERHFYEYREGEGVTRYRSEGGATSSRCGGRMTFDDLRALAARAHAAEAQNRMILVPPNATR